MDKTIRPSIFTPWLKAHAVTKIVSKPRRGPPPVTQRQEGGRGRAEGRPPSDPDHLTICTDWSHWAAQTNLKWNHHEDGSRRRALFLLDDS